MPQDFLISNILGMYLHRPTGEYRLLLHRRSPQRSVIDFLLCRGEIECYVFALGSDEPPRRIQWPDAASGLWFRTPALARDSLHWFPEQDQGESRPVIVFDTTAESFRQMRAPVVPTKSYIFEMDGTLGIYSCNNDMKAVYIWVLQNYEGEVWECKYQIELPVAKIRGWFGWREAGDFYVSVVSADRDILLLLSYCGSLFYVDINGKLVDSFHRDGQHLSANGLRLKQTLVPHNFFKALEDRVVKTPPFI
uniref:Uncharacterized protein n=1 Tax=Avena sativa TaxID=4498 RepID=A0ACD5XFQ0_AVESA